MAVDEESIVSYHRHKYLTQNEAVILETVSSTDSFATQCCFLFISSRSKVLGNLTHTQELVWIFRFNNPNVT